MTFEGQYLSYAEYQELGGSAIGEMPFNLLEFEARRQIDIKTSNRIKQCGEIPQEAKLCDNALINSIIGYAKSTDNASSNGNVASETTDGYSVSYLTSDKIKEIVNSKNIEIRDIINTYFTGVIINGEHALYCGVKQ